MHHQPTKSFQTNQISDNGNYWLLQRIRSIDKNYEPQFAFNATVNWARALAIECTDTYFSDSDLTDFYKTVTSRNPKNDPSDTLVCISIFNALRKMSALNAMRDTNESIDLASSAIIAWYYVIYHAASAMIAAHDGSSQENHKSTASAWNRQIVQNDLIPTPFCWRVSSLEKQTFEREIEQLRMGNTFNISKLPKNKEQARGACFSYLQGTANYERKKHQQELCKSLKVTNFRTKKARMSRSQKLDKKPVCFLHEAYRYRVKANYQDALYLGYGISNTNRFQCLIEDLCIVGNCFLRAAAYYCSRRIGKSLWMKFTNDIENNSQLTTPHNIIVVEWN